MTETRSTTPFSALSIIHQRKRREKHSRQELEWFISEFTAGRIPRYQMSAWLMAVCFCPLSPEEIAILTRCMVDSGPTLQWEKTSESEVRFVDKHSSGGVGDKTSLLLAPWLAAVDPSILVPMMAGRGLAHTGGTIDKLESIPGFNASLTIADFQHCVQNLVGCAITSPTKELCPADKSLYALRDVTGTVESIGLQTASIISKKIAENPNFLVLDVKYGQGAFQSNKEAALELAGSMVHTAHANGLPAVALLTRMDHPLGRAVGNWVEVVECVELMTPAHHSKRSPLSRDLMIVTLVLALEMLQFATKKEEDLEEKQSHIDTCLDRLIEALQSGAVRSKFDEMVKAQGGDISVLEEQQQQVDSLYHFYGPPAAQLKAPCNNNNNNNNAGGVMITNIHAQKVGHVCVALGAGRLKAEDAVDPGAGIVWHKQVGDKVQKGDDVVADVYYTPKLRVGGGDEDDSDDAAARCLEQLQACIEYDTTMMMDDDEETQPRTTPAPPPMVTHKVTIHGVEDYVIPPRLIEFASSWCS